MRGQNQTLDVAAEEYIKKYFRIIDGKLYRIKEISLDMKDRQIHINGKLYLSRKVFGYLKKGEWADKRINNTSGYVGIKYSPLRKRWLVRLTRDNCLILNNKVYKTKEEAIEAYNKALGEYNSKQANDRQ